MYAIRSYYDTAVFVVDLIKKDAGIELTLNTLDTITLDPGSLYIKEDALFMETDAHLVKFTQKALAQMTPFLIDTSHGLVFKLGQVQAVIREK